MGLPEQSTAPSSTQEIIGSAQSRLQISRAVIEMMDDDGPAAAPVGGSGFAVGPGSGRLAGGTAVRRLPTNENCTGLAKL